MNRLSPVFAAFALLTLAGCNAILGIEKAKVVPREGDDGSVTCVEDACVPTPTACTSWEQCQAGEACIDGVCVVPEDADGGVRSDAGDAASDAPMGDGGGDAGCKENEFRCEGTALPTRLQCVGGVWKSGAPCDDGKLCDSKAAMPGECKPALAECLGREPNKPFCLGAERKTCGPDLVTITSLTCATREHCSMATGAECAPCVMGEAKCEGDQLLICNSAGTGFEAKQMCNAGECKANLMRCSPLVCDPEAYTCSPDNKLLHCNDSGTAYLSMEDCGKGVCDAEGKQCDRCKPNEVLGCAEGDKTSQSVCSLDGQSMVKRTCQSLDPAKPACTGLGLCVGCEPLSNVCQSNTTLLSCSGSGVSSASTCTKTTCVGDRCAGECAPGDQICAGTASPGRKVCGPNGMYMAGTDCPSGSLCDNSTPGGECRPIAMGCTERQSGEAGCVGATRIVCGPDRVSTTSSMACASSNHCMLGTGAACAACLDNEHKCVGAELQVCNAAHTSFVSKKVCANEALCSAGVGDCTTQVCLPNEWYCNPGNLLQQCNETGTAYKSTMPCGSNTCDKVEHQCDICSPGAAVSCAANGQLNRCSTDGQRLVPENCPSGTPVCDGGTCKECAPNVNTCATSTSVSTCDGMGRKGTLTCPAHTTCFQGSCQGECAPGEFRCPKQASTDRESCGTNGRFTATTSCASTQRCDQVSDTCMTIATGCNGKNPGDAACVGQTSSNRVICGADLINYSSTTSCTSQGLCEQGNGTACATCVTNQYNCNGAQLQICNAAHTGWQDQGQPCVTAALCNKTLGMCTTATCSPSQWSCNGDQLRHCNPDGTGYISADTRSCGAGLCNASAGRCNVCSPNVVRCVVEGDKSRVKCASDGSGESTAGTSACPNACLNATCVDCAPNATRCDPTSTTTQVRFRQTCSPSGSWGSGTDCFASNKTCTFNAMQNQFMCDGVCASGRDYACMNPFPGSSFVCGTNGQYGFVRDCMPSVPERCETRTGLPASGQCVTNSTFYMCATGAEAADCNPGSETRFFNNDVIAQPFIPLEDVKLVQFGVRTGPTSSGGAAYFGLHTDASGQPGTMMNRTLGTNLAVGSPNLTPPRLSSAAATDLTKGVRYWLVLRLSASGQTPKFFTSSTNVAAGATRFGTAVAADPVDMVPNETLPGAGGQVALFIQVRRRY